MVRFKNKNIYLESTTFADRSTSIAGADLKQVNFVEAVTNNITVTLPSPSKGLFYEITNTGTTGKTLTVEDHNNATIIVLYDGDASTFISQASAWKNLGSAGGDQNLYATIGSDVYDTTANSTTDTLTISGGDNSSSAVSGDTLTINRTQLDKYAVKRDESGDVVYKTAPNMNKAFAGAKTGTTNPLSKWTAIPFVMKTTGAATALISNTTSQADLGGNFVNPPNQKIKITGRLYRTSVNISTPTGPSVTGISPKINKLTQILSIGSGTAFTKTFKKTISANGFLSTGTEKKSGPFILGTKQPGMKIERTVTMTAAAAFSRNFDTKLRLTKKVSKIVITAATGKTISLATVPLLGSMNISIVNTANMQRDEVIKAG